MMTNRKPLVSVHDDPLILVCADLQIEYLTEGRRHVIADADAISSRCLELMTLWRNNLWPILHLKRIAQAAWFNPASNLTNWIAELKPRPGELAFEHPLPSAYSSTRFAEYMANMICRPLSTAFTAATAIRSSAMPWPAGGSGPAMRLPTKWRWSRLSATSPASWRARTSWRPTLRSRYDQVRPHHAPVPESQIGIAAHPSRRPLRDLLSMRSNSLKHNNLMLRSERRERLEAWAASDSPISHSQYYFAWGCFRYFSWKREPRRLP